MTAPVKNIAADLDNLLKRASVKKTEVVKKAEEVDAALNAAEVGKTVAPTSGTQAAGIKAEEKKTYTAAAVGTGAETNQTNASVTNSPQGAAAASTNGEKGADAPAEMGSTVTNTTVNGDVMGAPKGNDTSGSFKSAQAIALMKAAADLDALADASLDSFSRFLAKSARASTNPEVKKVAEGMDDQDLGQAAGDNLSGQIENQQMTDDEAAQILQEAVASGAITEEELAAAVAELQGQGGAEAGAPAPAGADADGAAAPMGDAAGIASPSDVPPVPAAPGAMAEEAPPMPMADAKMAAANIGPDHADYNKKVASLYAAEVEAGKELARLVFGQTKAAAAPVETKVASHDGLKAESEDEKKALAAVQKELGIDDSQLKALNEAPSKSMDKHAALAAQYRTQILNKIASLG